MYIRCASINCFSLERQEAWRALSRACAKTGNRIAARIAMMAITTSNSISVNARRERQCEACEENPEGRMLWLLGPVGKPLHRWRGVTGPLGTGAGSCRWGGVPSHSGYD